MGLIRAAVGAIGSTLSDQWKEVISCENMPNDVLMEMRTSKNGTISKGSIVRVTVGQCAAIYQNGTILDATAEPGDYTFDESATPSFFAGQFKAVFKEMWTRFTFNGATKNNQVVFFFNTKEIIDNKFGTQVPVMYSDYSHAIPNKMTGTLDPLPVKVRCHGNYTFKVTDPTALMKEVAGTETVFKKDKLVVQMKSEIIEVLNNVLNQLGSSQMKYPVMDLPSASDEIKEMLAKGNYDEAIKRRGLTITGITIEGIDVDEESRKFIKDYVLSSNDDMQRGTLVGAYSDALRDPNKKMDGASSAIFGINMTNAATSGMFSGATNNANGQEMQTANPNKWICKCGAENTGKFCSECGSQKEERKCPKCNTTVEKDEKFCHECGEKL